MLQLAYFNWRMEESMFCYFLRQHVHTSTLSLIYIYSIHKYGEKQTRKKI